MLIPYLRNEHESYMIYNIMKSSANPQRTRAVSKTLECVSREYIRCRYTPYLLNEASVAKSLTCHTNAVGAYHYSLLCSLLTSLD